MVINAQVSGQVIPEKNESATQRESHVGVEHGAVPLQEGDQGGGEGGQLLLVALGHLSHSCLITCPIVHSLWWIVT